MRKPSITHVIVGLVMMIFMIDAISPTAWTFYVLSLGLIYWAPTRYAPVLTATASSPLLRIGFFVSSSCLLLWSGLVKRMAAACMLSIGAVLRCK